MKWDQEKVVDFIKIYSTKNILWDPKHKHYYNKKCKKEAWVEISRVINFPVEELKRKMENLLGQLRREKAKMKKFTAQGTNDVFESSWYGYEHMSFLISRKKTRRRSKSEESDVSASSNEPQSLDEWDEHKSQPNMKQSSSSQNISSTANFKAPVAVKKEVNDAAKRMVNSAFEMVSSASANDVSTIETSSNVDDSQMYANFIASKLRQYSQRTKNALQHHISNLLFQADNGYYDVALRN